MKKTRVIIFDDSAPRRDSLRVLISLYPDLEFCGAFEDCSRVLEVIDETQPDVVLMDIEMPNVNGIQGVSIIRKKHPELAVIMQTISEDDNQIFESIMAGASGYILKKASPEKIIEAIRDSVMGGSPMTPAIAQRVLMFFKQQVKNTPENDYTLTPREIEILALLVDGLSYKMIAAKVDLSYHTVNAHIRNIYDKLHVHSMGEAVAKALKERLV